MKKFSVGRFLSILSILFLLPIPPAMAMEINASIDGEKWTTAPFPMINPGYHEFVFQFQGSYPITIVNYTIKVEPESVSVFLEKWGIPISDEINLPIFPGENLVTIPVEIPEKLCGNFVIKVALTYEEDGRIKDGEWSFPLHIRCTSLKALLFYFLLKILPPSILQGIL